MGVETFLGGLSADFLQTIFQEWAPWLQLCLEGGGEPIEWTLQNEIFTFMIAQIGDVRPGQYRTPWIWTELLHIESKIHTPDLALSCGWGSRLWTQIAGLCEKGWVSLIEQLPHEILLQILVNPSFIIMIKWVKWQVRITSWSSLGICYIGLLGCGTWTSECKRTFFRRWSSPSSYNWHDSSESHGPGLSAR
jgi:hypothetical protein